MYRFELLCCTRLFTHVLAMLCRYRVRQSLIEAAAMLNLLDDCSDFANEIAAARETMGMAPAPAVATSSIADST